MEKTGNILKKYMKYGMTQIELGKIIEVTPQYINNIINNIKGPSENFLEKFYEIFDVSEEDKNKIKEYEEFRKLPEKYKKEILFLRGDGVQIEKSEIKVLGNFNLHGIFEYSEKDEKNYFPKSFINEEEFFSIKLYCKKYEPNYFENDILIFKKIIQKEINYINFNQKKCLIRYKTEILLYELKYVDEIIILISLGDNENIKLIKKENYNDVEIIGILKGYFRI